MYERMVTGHRVRPHQEKTMNARLQSQLTLPGQSKCRLNKKGLDLLRSQPTFPGHPGADRLVCSTRWPWARAWRR